MVILAPISVGELFDKITILNIKLVEITDEQKKQNVRKEYDQLNSLVEKNIQVTLELQQLYLKLYEINRNLWDIENKKRQCEKDKKFDQEFIELSRQVYIQNDLRAKIKKEINLLTNSDIIEEKQH